MTFPIYAVVLVLWAAFVLVLIYLTTGREMYGRRATDMSRRKDDQPPEQYMGLGFWIPFMALWRRVSPWNGEERRDHERRSGV